MPKLQWMKWYPMDYINDTRELSIEAKGCLVDILCFMWNSENRGTWAGTYQEFARVTGCAWEFAPSIIHELSRKALRVTERDNSVTLENRRMIREYLHYKNNANRQRQYRFRHKSNAIVTDKTPLDSSRLLKTQDLKTTSTTNKVGASAPVRQVFSKPSALEVKDYAKSIGFELDGERFCDHYEANGWKVGRNPMRSWQAAVRTWKNRNPGGTLGTHDSKSAYSITPPKERVGPLGKTPSELRAILDRAKSQSFSPGVRDHAVAAPDQRKESPMDDRSPEPNGERK